MSSAPAGAPPAPALHPMLLGLALVLLAVNLRPTVASLPPLLSDIERDLRLSGPSAGLLTALPVVCMAWFAPASHRLAHRFGREATALGAITLVALGNGIRGAGQLAPALYAGTFLAGLGVAACGVVLPGIVKEFFPGREGAASSAYVVAMMIGAAAAAGLSVPLEQWLGSWPAALAAWALPAAAAAALWVPVTARLNVHESEGESSAGRLPWRHPGAWLLAGFFSVQAALAYAYLGWLAPAYEARGWSPGTAGVLLGVLNFTQLFTSLALPVLADRLRDRRPALAAAIACTVVGGVWLFALPDTLPWVATSVLGLGLGGGFSLSMVLIVDLAAVPAASSRVAAMVFVIGYSVAAIAPVVVGALRDATGGFTVPFGLLTILAAVQLVLATRLGPGHRGTVG